MFNMFKKTISSLIFILIFYLFILSKSVLAIRYNLVLPSGPFERGQSYEFTIRIDTQGETITSGSIGMTYDTQYLEYISTTPGEAMTSVSTNRIENGKLLLSGNNSNGFSGTGVFAKVTLKLIAQAPGETTLCVLWNPETSPTPNPTSPPQEPTNPPQATALPTSGETKKTITASFLALGMFISSGIFFYFNKKIVFDKKPKK